MILFEVDGPMDIDISDDLKSTFGCVEFEDSAIKILRYLSDANRSPNIASSLGESGTGWQKKMRIDTVDGIGPSMFAMLCAAGWLQNTWFPKGTFVVSPEFIERIKGRRKKAKA